LRKFSDEKKGDIKRRRASREIKDLFWLSSILFLKWKAFGVEFEDKKRGGGGCVVGGGGYRLRGTEPGVEKYSQKRVNCREK